MTNMDKLYEAVEARGPVCVGLDTDFSYLPADFVDSTLSRGENIVRFNKKLIDATKAVAGCYKVQIAYYESLGLEGIDVYKRQACWCREQPLAVTTGIGIDEHDHEGRVLTLEYPAFWLVNCYTPNSQDGLKRLDYRMEWENAFRAYLLALDAKKPVILCGDLNVAHTEIDIKNAKTNRMSAGFTDQERGKMTELLDAGFADSFRVLHPDEVKYSWWSYRFHAREKNAGWRIDYFIVSRRIADRIRAAEIHNEIFGSDHCPVELDIDL